MSVEGPSNLPNIPPHQDHTLEDNETRHSNHIAPGENSEFPALGADEPVDQELEKIRAELMLLNPQGFENEVERKNPEALPDELEVKLFDIERNARSLEFDSLQILVMLDELKRLGVALESETLNTAFQKFSVGGVYHEALDQVSEGLHEIMRVLQNEGALIPREELGERVKQINEKRGWNLKSPYR